MKELGIKNDPVSAKTYTVYAINKKTRTILRIWIKKKKIRKNLPAADLNIR